MLKFERVWVNNAAHTGRTHGTLAVPLTSDGYGMASRSDELRDEIRLRILRRLQMDPGVSQRELARDLGISSGGAHYALKALVDKGFVKLGNFAASSHKRRYAYVLTPVGISEKAALTARFLRRKIEEYEMMREEIDTLLAELNGANIPKRDA